MKLNFAIANMLALAATVTGGKVEKRGRMEKRDNHATYNPIHLILQGIISLYPDWKGTEEVTAMIPGEDAYEVEFENDGQTVRAISGSAYAINGDVLTVQFVGVEDSQDPNVIANFSDTLPYYLVPDETVILDGSNSVTILETAYDDPDRVKLPGGSGQVIVLNQRGHVADVGFGAFVPSNITQAFTVPNVTDGKLALENATGFVLDQVLIPPIDTVNTSLLADLNTFAAALQQTNLNTAANDLVGLTIFAPSDDAFASFQAENPNVPPEELKAVLLNHVVQSDQVFYSPSLYDEIPFNLTSLGGAPLLFTTDYDGEIKVNGSTVFLPNILTMNGVIHGINHVLNGGLVFDEGSQ